ncbi:hypothetical protein KKB83_02550 [Patescibacteria group bacterium]|nr:hypothetical protein [Patescibacteria group bacterium]
MTTKSFKILNNFITLIAILFLAIIVFLWGQQIFISGKQKEYRRATPQELKPLNWSLDNEIVETLIPPTPGPTTTPPGSSVTPSTTPEFTPVPTAENAAPTPETTPSE